jgi:hypothetical protein
MSPRSGIWTFGTLEGFQVISGDLAQTPMSRSDARFIMGFNSGKMAGRVSKHIDVGVLQTYKPSMNDRLEEPASTAGRSDHIS